MASAFWMLAEAICDQTLVFRVRAIVKSYGRVSLDRELFFELEALYTY